MLMNDHHLQITRHVQGPADLHLVTPTKLHKKQSEAHSAEVKHSGNKNYLKATKLLLCP